MTDLEQRVATLEQLMLTFFLERGDRAGQELLTADELAQRLGFGEKRGVETIYRWTKEGKLPHLDTGAGYRYDWAEVYAHFHHAAGSRVTRLDPPKQRSVAS